MATTPNPLVWDFVREIEDSDSVGSTVHFFDNEDQVLYLRHDEQSYYPYKKFSYLCTQVGSTIENGDWEGSELNEEIILDQTSLWDTLFYYKEMSFDHPINGVLHGVMETSIYHPNGTSEVYPNGLVYCRYIYAIDLSNFVSDFKWTSKLDNSVDQLSLSVMNGKKEILTTISSLFGPGSRIPAKVRLGPNELISIGIAYVDELDYDAGGETASISGRNAVGFYLKDQFIGEDGKYEQEVTKTIIDYLIEKSGYSKFDIGFKYMIDEDDPSHTPIKIDFDYQASDDILGAFQSVCEKIESVDGYHIEDGRSQSSGLDIRCDPNGVIIMTEHEYNAPTNYDCYIKDCFSRQTTKSIDAVYGKLRATCKILAPNMTGQSYILNSKISVGEFIYYEAPEFDRGKTYPNAGIFVKYNGKVYKSLNAIHTEFNYNGSDWMQVSNKRIRTDEGDAFQFDSVNRYNPASDYNRDDYVKGPTGGYFKAMRDIYRDFNPNDWELLSDEENGKTYDTYICRNTYPESTTPISAYYFDFWGSEYHEPITVTIDNYRFWYTGINRICFEEAPELMTRSDFIKWTDMRRRALSYGGITEKITGQFRPDIVLGDGCNIWEGRVGQDKAIVGRITSIEHSYSSSEGFKTSFTVDSGGVIENSDGSFDMVSRFTKKNGYNRQQGIVDLVYAIGERDKVKYDGRVFT